MSIVVQVWKCRSVVQSTRSSRWRKKAGMSWMSSSGLSSLGDDQQVLGQRHLALAQDGVGLGEQFLRLALGRVGHVALAADGQQQRMHAGGVDRVDGVDAGQHGGNDRAGQLVDQLAERRVLLRRTANGRERPDRVLADGTRHRPASPGSRASAVIAQVVAKRAFGLGGAGVDRAGDHEVGLGGERQPVARLGRPDHREPPAAERAGEGQFGEALGQRHHGGHRPGRAGRPR